jgi:6-pyruvoyltetrahydropterin/6-carboxytetrahydropterin synthase
MFELSKQFRFEAAHTLNCTIDEEPSRRIHGHSYRAKVIIRGEINPETGMLLDLAVFERALRRARDVLDHRFLDEVTELGPATIENLASWIWRTMAPSCPGLARVTVYRDSSGDESSYFGTGGGFYG